MAKSERGIDNLVDNEKAFVIGGWMLASQGQDWFRHSHLGPIMTELHNRRRPEKLFTNTANETVRVMTKKLGSLGLVETGLRRRADNPRIRPMLYHRLTETGMQMAPQLYIQHEMPLITGPEQLKEWLTLPLSQLALYDIPLPQIPAAEIEHTQPLAKTELPTS